LKAVLLDTHAWAYSIIDDRKLGRGVKQAMNEAAAILISPISVFEIAQKVRLGKWKQMEAVHGELPALVTNLGSSIATLSPEICLSAAKLDWLNRDPFDRILAATAMHYGAALISADAAFDTLPKGTLKRIW
jgi:PIN domain nuclease of toxin-antitoxin system